MLADDQSILVHTPITKNNLESGKILFSKYCSTCHREKDRSIASSFKNYTWKHGSTNKDIANSIVNGIPGKAMAAWWRMLTPEEVGKLVIYISTLSDE